MTDFTISDIRKTQDAYASMSANESFLHPYDLKYDVPVNMAKHEPKDWHTGLGIKEAREYLDTIVDSRQLRLFMSMSIPEIRRLFYIKYGLEFLGEGSSRIVFKATSNSVLKVAYNFAGLMQNKAEAHDKHVKNEYGCFPHLFWSSRNDIAIECENVEETDSEQEFESITWVNFNDFIRSLDYLQFVHANTRRKQFYNLGEIGLPPYRSEESKVIDEYRECYNDVTKELNSHPKSAAKSALKNLMHYITTKNSPREFIASDLSNISNWGKAVRNGETICVPADTGGTSFVLRNYYSSGEPVNVEI